MKNAGSGNSDDYSISLSQFFTDQQSTGIKNYLTQVLKNNPDLRSLGAMVKATDFNIAITKAETQPHADINLSGNRSKDTVTKEIINGASASLDIAWTPDIWGRHSNNAAAARYSAEKSRFDLLQERRTLISHALHAWVEYSNYVRTERDLVDLDTILSKLLGHYKETYEEGLSPYVFFLDAGNRRKQNQSRLEGLQLLRLKTLQNMNTLRGRPPKDKFLVLESQLPVSLAHISHPADPIEREPNTIQHTWPNKGMDDNLTSARLRDKYGFVTLPESISSTSLANRPDIQAAFADIQAFNSTARSAHKALLPQIKLTGSTLKNGETLRKAFRGDLVWHLVGGLTQRLFNGGQLRAIAKQKSAEAEASWWQYRGIVLQSMLEVENAMVSDTSLSRQLGKKHSILKDLAHKMYSSEERFADGDFPISTYLHIKAEYIETQIELREIMLRYLKNRLTLVMALGLPIEPFGNANNE